MIEVETVTEFGTYTKKLNHGHPVNHNYMCCDFYAYPDDIDNWMDCPCCGFKPKVHIFDNGSNTGCGCGKTPYDHFAVHAESIISHIKHSGGSLVGYDGDALRKNWNEYCATMINPCSHADLRLEGKW